LKSSITQGLRKAALAVTVSGAVALTGVVATGGPAAAAPSSCHLGKVYDIPGNVWYRCDKGSGYYRAVAYCAKTPGGGFTYIFGPWLGVGSDLPSYAICPSDKPYLEGGFGDS
jgi:hypothetical protein